MKIRFHAENVLPAICMSVVFILVFPVLATFMSPGVAESVNPGLNECDIYYKDVYYPCITLSEAYFINLKFGTVFAIIVFIVIIFLEPDMVVDEEGVKI